MWSVTLVPRFGESRGVSVLQYGYAEGVEGWVFGCKILDIRYYTAILLYKTPYRVLIQRAV